MTYDAKKKALVLLLGLALLRPVCLRREPVSKLPVSGAPSEDNNKASLLLRLAFVFFGKE
jgi:hypothetical protein